MFKSISDKFKAITDKILKNNVLTETSLNELLREFRLVLLEADIPLQLTKEIIESLKQDLLGKEIYRSLQAKDVVTKALYDVLINQLNANQTNEISYVNSKYIMLVGLQGVGKTTSSAKLAYYIQKQQGKKTLVVSLDLARKAAYEQLQQLASSNGIDFFEYTAKDLKLIINNLQKFVATNHYDCVIIDTAGRLSINQELMDELGEIERLLNIKQTWLVLDSMLGQSSIEVITDFTKAVNINGLIITKADSDYKGGVVIAAKYITGKSIKFLGSGEKITDIQAFNAEKIVSRILGQQDIDDLIEKLEDIEEADAQELEESLLKGNFSLNHYKKQISLMSKLGGLGSIASFIPGMGAMAGALNNNKIGNTTKKHIAIINSMTEKEKLTPDILNFSRKKRIASGSGTTLTDINIMFKQYNIMRDMMKSFSKNTSKLKDLQNPDKINDMVKSLQGMPGMPKNLSNFNLSKFLKK